MNKNTKDIIIAVIILIGVLGIMVCATVKGVLNPNVPCEQSQKEQP